MIDEEPSAADQGPADPAPAVTWGPAESGPAVTWAPPPPESQGISIGGVLRDAFARYGADPIRLFLVGVIPSVVSLFVSEAAGPSFIVTILGLVATATVMVLGDRGRSMPFGAALRLGVRRVGWMWLSALVIVVAIGLVALIPGVLIFPTARTNVGLFLVLVGILAVPLLWIYVRLVLALPAVVIDDVGTGEALGRARAATRGWTATGQAFAIVFVAGLASIPVGLGAGALIAVNIAPTGLVYLVGGILSALVAPVSPLALVSLYRRVNPRYPDRFASVPGTGVTPAMAAPAGVVGPRSMYDTSWAPEVIAAAQALDGADDPVLLPAVTPAVPLGPPAAPASPAAIPPPAYGRLARGLAGSTLALGIAGILTFGWAIGAVAIGAIGTTSGNVPRGTIAFGSSANLATCTLSGQFSELPRGGSLVWVGSFAKRTTPSDRVRLSISYEGIESGSSVEQAGIYDCLGTDAPETGIEPGRYELTIYVNDQVSATGGFTAR